MHEIVVIGNLGQDPEMRYTPAGVSVTSFSIASNRKWRDSDGQQQEETTWFRITCWRNLADIANQWLEKGSQVYVRGRPEINTFEDRNGDSRASFEVTAFDLQMLGSNRGRDRDSGERQQQGGRENNSGGGRQQGSGQRSGNARQGQGGSGNRQSGGGGNRGGNSGGGGNRQRDEESDRGNQSAASDDWGDTDDLPF